VGAGRGESEQKLREILSAARAEEFGGAHACDFLTREPTAKARCHDLDPDGLIQILEGWPARLWLDCSFEMS